VPVLVGLALAAMPYLKLMAGAATAGAATGAGAATDGRRQPALVFGDGTEGGKYTLRRALAAGA